MSDQRVEEILSALEGIGANPRCPSCNDLDWTGWDVGAIPRYLPTAESPDWLHGLAVTALICNRCAFIRLHAPARLEGLTAPTAAEELAD